MMRNNVQKLNIALFILTLILNLTCPGEVNWQTYPDAQDYLHQSEIPLNSAAFYAPVRTDSFAPRPFTTPLFYKLAGSNPAYIIILQKIMHSLAAFILAGAILLLLSKNAAKYFALIAIYFLFSWPNIFGWTNNLLSESLALSLMFVWISTLVFLYYKPGLGLLSLHILVTLLFSFTRDTWPYIISLTYAILLCGAYLLKWSKKEYYVLLLILSVPLFFIQQHTAQTGERYKLPVTNNIAFRILPNAEYTNWFVQQGMPQADELKQYFNGNYTDANGLFALYQSKEFNPFYNWVVTEGKSVYMRFLLTHPTQSLLLHENSAQLKRIIAYNLHYTGWVKGYAQGAHFVFPIFHPILLAVLLIWSVILFVRSKRYALLVPLLLLFVTSIHAVLLYNADTLEVERHLMATRIMIELCGILLVALIVDNMLAKKHIATVP